MSIPRPTESMSAVRPRQAQNPRTATGPDQCIADKGYNRDQHRDTPTLEGNDQRILAASHLHSSAAPLQRAFDHHNAQGCNPQYQRKSHRSGLVE